MIIVTPSFSESSVFKMFSVHSKTRSLHFYLNSSGLKNVFAGRISVDGRPNHRNKAALSNSSNVVWTER